MEDENPNLHNNFVKRQEHSFIGKRNYVPIESLHKSLIDDPVAPEFESSSENVEENEHEKLKKLA